MNNTHLLKLLSELVRTFFEITQSIECCLKCYINKHKLSLLNHVKSSEHLNELLKLDHENLHKLNKSSSFASYSTNAERNFSKSNSQNDFNYIKKAQQQINHFDDESICESLIPFRKPKQLRTVTTTRSGFNENSITLKESNTINNSNYFEVNCSYIVQLNGFKNSNSKNQSIIEDKKTYISANINVNNCYKSKNKELIKKNSSIGSDEEDEAYSDCTTDLSDNVDCPSYNFLLKSKQIQSNNLNNLINQDNRLQIQPSQINCQTSEQDLKDLIDQKMIIFNQSLINLTKCDNLIDFKDIHKLEIDKEDSNYSNFLEEEDLVSTLCKHLKELVKELIEFLNALSTGDIDKILKIILSKNADLSSKISYLRNENEQIENKIKCLNEKELNSKVEIINLRHLMNEYRQNQEHLEWIKNRVNNLKIESDQLKKQHQDHLGSIVDCENNLSMEEEETFQDCLESLDNEDNCNLIDNEDSSQTDKSLEIVLFDRMQFEEVYKSIQQSSHQMNMINLIDDEKFELNKLNNDLKNEIEKLILSNEELRKLKKLQQDDYTQHLNCLQKLISSNKKFLNEQTYDRDLEKDTFDNQLTKLKFLIKEKELNLSKYTEKVDFLKSDLEDLLTEKDELQCKNYNQEKKLIDITSKQNEMKQEIDKIQNMNNIGFQVQEQLRSKLDDLEKELNKQKLLFDKLKFDKKIELDESFFKMLDSVMNEINRYHINEKINEHLNNKRLAEKKLMDEKCLQKTLKSCDIQKSKSFVKCSLPSRSTLTRSSLSTPVKNNLKKDLRISDCSTPIRTNSFSLNNNIKFRKNNQANKFIPRSKSFMTDEFEEMTRLNRHSFKLNDESFTNFLSKLKSSNKKCLDDEEFYSFKECSSLISLNNDLNNFDDFKSNDSLSSFRSSFLDEGKKENHLVRETNLSNLTNSNIVIDAKRSLSEDTFYFSLASDDASNELDLDLNDFYLQLDHCKDAEKLKHYFVVITCFFRKITKSIAECKDNLQNTSLGNRTKKLKLAELEKTIEQLRSIYDKEVNNLENLQNDLNKKHLELSKLKDQIDSNQDNSLFLENKQISNDLDQRMIDNQEKKYILTTNLNHLEKNLKKKETESNNFRNQLSALKRSADADKERNDLLKNDNEILEKENIKLKNQLKMLREAKLMKRLKMMKK